MLQIYNNILFYICQALLVFFFKKEFRVAGSELFTRKEVQNGKKHIHKRKGGVSSSGISYLHLYYNMFFAIRQVFRMLDIK